MDLANPIFHWSVPGTPRVFACRACKDRLDLGIWTMSFGFVPGARLGESFQILVRFPWPADHTQQSLKGQLLLICSFLAMMIFNLFCQLPYMLSNLRTLRFATLRTCWSVWIAKFQMNNNLRVLHVQSPNKAIAQGFFSFETSQSSGFKLRPLPQTLMAMASNHARVVASMSL